MGKNRETGRQFSHIKCTKGWCAQQDCLCRCFVANVTGPHAKTGSSPCSGGARLRGAARPCSGADTRGLLDRILDTPHLAHVVPRLPPEVLHRVIQNCGLEECGELVALATPGQLARVFDLDLWRPAQPGLDEQFDADRFGLWLEVMMESGAASAAQTLAGVDVDLAIAAFAQHVRVFDPAAVSPPVDGRRRDARRRRTGRGAQLRRRRLPGRRRSAPTRGTRSSRVLVALDAQHHDYFHRVMRGCRSLSNSGSEVDGLDDLLPDDEQVMFDLAFTRERRREQQGYVTPAQARAFLQMSRQVRLGRRHHAARPIPSPAPTSAPSNGRRRRPTDSGVPRLPAASDAPSAGGLRRCGRRHRRRAARRGHPPAAAARAARRTAGAGAASRAHPGAHAVRR